MPTFTTLDATLNPHKCFKNTPPATLKSDHLPTLPEDWLTQLENKCREIRPNLVKNIFFKHIGSQSKYQFKKILTEQLSIFYYRIFGYLDSQLGRLDSESKFLLLLCLTEDIQQCPEGFHIRVNKLVNSFQVPKNLDQLLCLVRKNIIQQIATDLTANVPITYQVHVADRVIRIAEKLGLGITPNIQKDPYKSLLSGEMIRKKLKDEFPKHYTPLKIPFLLADQLKLILNQQGYIGPLKEGYAIGPAENMLEIIKIFLTNPAQNNHNKLQSFFILDKLDEFNEPTRIYDINWNIIRQLFFQALIDANYFITTPNFTNLVEYAYFQSLFPEQANSEVETQFIIECLEAKNYGSLLDDLNLIRTELCDYWKKLKNNSLLIKNIDNFFDFLRHQSLDVNTNEQLKRINLTYTLFFSQTEEFVLRKIVSQTEKNLRIVNDVLLCKLIIHAPKVINELLSIILKKFNNQSRLLFNLLFTQNHENSHLLMIAARYDLLALQQLLLILNSLRDHYEKSEITTLFLAQNCEGWNLLNLAAKHQSGAISIIFDFIEKNSDLFDLKILSTLFNQRMNSQWGFFQLLVRYQSEAEINRCLDFVTAKFQLTKQKSWLTLVLNEEYNGNLLLLAAQSTKSAMKAILNFMSKHCQELNSGTLPHFFLASNDKGWNCLHKAAYNEVSNLELILEFIQKNSNQFNASSLCSLFLKETETQTNFLYFAVYFQPAHLVAKIFKFLNQHIEFFDKSSLQQFLLQQNSNGWNCLHAAYSNSASTKIILAFINENSDKLSKETLKEIILQKDKYNYNCLHLTAQSQPDSLAVILNFIEQRFDFFANELKILFDQNNSKFQCIPLFQKSNSQPNLLELSSKNQPESAKHLSSFLITHANHFNLKKSFLKNFIDKANNKTSLNSDQWVSDAHRSACV